jgi:hypothetical protein
LRGIRSPGARTRGRQCLPDFGLSLGGGALKKASANADLCGVDLLQGKRPVCDLQRFRDGVSMQR